MSRAGSIVLLLVALGGCTRAAPPAEIPAPETSASPAGAARPTARPVPVPAAFREALKKGTRSESGAPGSGYWQQRVRYEIEAELDPKTARLTGSERITYHNRSPEAVGTMYLNLYQNVFSEGVPRNRTVPITGGVELRRVSFGGETLRLLTPEELRAVPSGGRPPAGYLVQGTLARIILPREIAPGDSARLEVEWRHTVPPRPSFRTSWEDALGGRVLQVAQWYPQIAVLDDVYGWDATPYLGDGEFYLEYGDFDVHLTLPAGWLVGASGTLENADEVLTPEARRRLASVLTTDSVVRVVTESDLAARDATQRGRNGSLTWRFRAENVRDFAFATSDRYVWDATRAMVPVEGGAPRAIPVHAFYRPGSPGWESAARYTEQSVELLGERLVPYPYAQMTTSEGPIYGMEYPMLIFIARPAEAVALFGVIAHEVGHQWFPMMVGQNEAAYAWMDEGLTEFHESFALERYFPGDDPFLEDTEIYLRFAGTEREVPLMRHTDLVIPYGQRVVAAYTKPAVMLRSLREVIGAETFDRAMRTYAREWAFKHPYPWDFFHTFERVAGQELDWFFYPWWFETATLDQAVESVIGASTGTATVTVRDLGEVAAPSYVVGTTASGATVSATIPGESWIGGAPTATVTLTATEPIVRVELDPRRIFPDVDRENGVWSSEGGR